MECPDFATCNGGYKINVLQGYWRKSNISTEVFECFNADACLGGYESSCAVGYGSNLCHSCVKVENIWYTRE